MIFSQTHWVRQFAKRMDKPLRAEILKCYNTSRSLPCFIKDMISNIRYHFKKIKVIVRLEDDITASERRSIHNMMKFKEGKNSRSLKTLNCYPASLTPKAISNLLQTNSVKTIYLDRKMKALLDNASPSLNAPYAWDNIYLTGKGITTAVIDTGIYSHKDLEGRIVAFKDFVNNKADAYDDNGHGTHVAGDIASNGSKSDGKYKAPAYESQVVGVKVLNKWGSGGLSTVISGIEWCIENKEKYNIRIINLSLGGEAVDPYKDDLCCEAVENAWNAGIVVCIAAGNEGPESSTIGSPGIDPVVITVGAANDRNTISKADDTIANFSSRGPTIDKLIKPDVICPGENIVSLRSPFSTLDCEAPYLKVNKYYTNLSGTSMATPICCSCVALLLEKYPHITPDQVKETLTSTCQNMGSAYDKNTQGAGYVDIQKSLEYAALHF